MITRKIFGLIEIFQTRTRAFFFVMLALPLGILALPALYRLSIKKPPNSWGSMFEGKKVLILGSGPSSVRFKECMEQESYDTVVYINHAVDWAGVSDEEWFFSTDIRRVKEVLKKRFGINNIVLGRRVVAPIAPFQFFLYPISYASVQLIFTSSFSAKVRLVNQWIFWRRIKVTFPYFYLIPSLPSAHSVEQWWRNRKNILRIPLYSGSSALSAVMFIAFSRPALIHLIGCDFRDQDQKDSTGRDRFEAVASQFACIQRSLRLHGVTVLNLSDKRKVPRDSRHKGA